MLLKQEDVNVENKHRSFGQTLLILVAQNGHDKVVRVLLRKEGVDVDREDGISGRTPLSFEAEEQALESS